MVSSQITWLCTHTPESELTGFMFFFFIFLLLWIQFSFQFQTFLSIILSPGRRRMCVHHLFFFFFSLGLAWNWLKTFSPWSQVVVIVHRMIVCMNECATPIDKSTTVTYIYSCTSRIELSSQSIYFVYTVFKGRSEAENMRHINNKMVCLVIVYDIYYFLARTNHFGHCSNTPKEYYLLHE